MSTPHAQGTRPAPAGEDGETVGELPPSNRVIDALERVMPDMPAIGLFMLLGALFLVASGANIGPTEEVLGALNDAAAATQAAGIYAAF